MDNLTIFSEFNGSVDSERGIIHGVSLIKAGEARGHGMQIDATTLSQVLTASKTYKSGVKVKLDHEGGAGDIVGIIKNIRMSNDGNKVIGDLHLLETHPKRAYILELANTAPDTFGLSISFENKPEVIGNDIMARCSRIRSADIVADPAANSGLFAERVDTLTDSMDENLTDLTAKNSEEFSKIASRIEEMEGVIKSLSEAIAKLTAAEEEEAEAEKTETEPTATEPEEKKADLSELNAKLDALSEAIKLGAGNTIKSPSANGSDVEVASDEPTTPKTFSEIVDALVKEGKSKVEATNFAVKNHPSEHRAFLVSLGCISNN
jgi:hypothetical protein